jgi:hypothetical protein
MIIILLGQSQTAYLEVRTNYPSLAGGFGDREQEHDSKDSAAYVQMKLCKPFHRMNVANLPSQVCRMSDPNQRPL